VSPQLIAEFDMLGRYIALNLNDMPKQQALILRKLGKIFAELQPDFKGHDLMYPYIRDSARGWLAHKALK